MANQVPTPLPEDVSKRVENSSINDLITELSKSTSLNREGLQILRKKIALTHYLEKLKNDRNALGGDVKVEETRAILNKQVVALELKQIAGRMKKSNINQIERQDIFNDFLMKYNLTFDQYKRAATLDSQVKTTELEINSTKKALSFYEAKLFEHNKTFDRFIIPKKIEIDKPRPADIRAIIDETVQQPILKPIENPSNNDSDILGLVEQFAK
jgi:hypothetical protein